MGHEQLLSAIEVLKYRYRIYGKRRQGQVLDELEAQFCVDRKYLIRLLAKKPGGRPKTPARRGRRAKYADSEFQHALRRMWKTTYYMCGRYLNAAIPEWLPAIEQQYGAFSEDVRARLLTISGSTIDRHLRPHKAEHGKTFTKPGGVIRGEIPVQGNIWDTHIPGYIECDTVAHCGGSMFGDFINSVTAVDIATTWTETRATWGRGSSGVLEQLKDVEATLPFPILGYDADNGGEVLNWHVIAYFQDRRIPVGVTRARAYHKNDNCHVEQKNNSIARRYLGYERLDCRELLPLINHYYKDILCPLLNHFYPTNKLLDKQLVNAKRKRFYDKPCTPYARVMASPDVDDVRKKQLKTMHESLNPVQLRIYEQKVRKQIDDAMKIFKSNKRIQRLNNLGFSPP